jgi:hypothetical protein
MTANRALQAVLAAEHAAVYGYGAVGAKLTGSERTAASAAESAHRARRDAVSLQLSGLKVTPIPAAPAYTLPFPVLTEQDALRLAVLLEERVAAAWRTAVPVTTGSARRTALAGLTDCAVRATRWRRVHTPGQPPTVAFPGE